MNSCRKKTIICVLLIGILVISIAYRFYEHHFVIDYRIFGSSYLLEIKKSPNEEYSVGIRVHKPSDNSGVVYLSADLYDLRYSENMNDGRMIFWKEVNSADIEIEKSDTGISQYNVDVSWLDEENLLINGQKVHIHRGYDYRRTLDSIIHKWNLAVVFWWK